MHGLFEFMKTIHACAAMSSFYTIIAGYFCGFKFLVKRLADPSEAVRQYLLDMPFPTIPTHIVIMSNTLICIHGIGI